MPANLGTELVTVQHPLTRYAREAGWTIVPQEKAGRSSKIQDLLQKVRGKIEPATAEQAPSDKTQ